MLHSLVKFWFECVEHWGYFGVFFLMALESSIVPVPSEVVMPPAAFWAAQGKMNFSGVVLAGTLGSLFGSVLNYWAARLLGYPLLLKYGKFVLLPEKKLKMAEAWVLQYGMMGIFIARLLPVVRHLISIPAGAFKMPFIPFCLVTTLGAGLWCWVLSWFGRSILGDQPQLLQSPLLMMAAVKARMHGVLFAVLAFIALYVILILFKKRMRK